MQLVPVPRPRPSLSLAAALRRWSAASQTRARRNAMVALTALTERRAQQEDVAAFLASDSRRPASGS